MTTLAEAATTIGWTAADVVWNSDRSREGLAEAAGLAGVDATTWGLVADALLTDEPVLA